MTDVATDEAEGGQALFCYIADILGDKQTDTIFSEYIESKDYAKFMNHPWPKRRGKTISDIIDEGFDGGRVDTKKSKKVILHYLSKKEDWFVSSLLIGKKIISTINKIDSDFEKIKKPGWDKLFYQHGDEEIMKVMDKLFKSANEQSKKISKFLSTSDKPVIIKAFGNVNKWTPADIYFASSKSKTDLENLLNEEQTQKNNLTFAKLNKIISQLIKSGDLLPLSLKKVKSNVIIKKVNFSPATEKKLLQEVVCTGIDPTWKKMSADYISKLKKFSWGKKGYSGGRDIYITFNEGDKKATIQIRHTPASGGKPIEGVKIVLKYSGSSALAGQIVGIPLLTNLISTVDNNFAIKLKTVFDSNYKKFEADANNYINFGGGKINYSSNIKKLNKKFNDDIGAISAYKLMNPVRKVIDEYFKNPDPLGPQHNVVRAIFQYAASRSLTSAKYIIAKD
jgi:hypothetical protein